MSRNSVGMLRKSVMSAVLLSFLMMGCSGESPEVLLASARDYLARNDSKAAVIQLKNALQKNPSLAEARFLLGRALLEGGEAPLAEVELRKALDLKHPAEHVLPLLASAMLQQGLAKKLTDEFGKTTLSSQEGQAGLQSTLGLAYLAQGLMPAAETAFKAALAEQPGYPSALIGQARLMVAGGDLPGALSVVEGVLEKSPHLHESWKLKGDILAAQGENEAALLAYRKALEVRPDYAPAHFSLIARLLGVGKLPEASQQLELLARIAQKHPQTTYLQAWLNYRQKNFQTARDLLQQHLLVMPDSVPGVQLAGLLEYELKSYVQAETHLLKVLPKTPELGLARRILVATYLRSGQTSKAINVLQPVLDKIDKDSNMLALAGEVFMQAGELERASGYFSRAAALDPESMRKRTSVALANLARGNTGVAFQELEQMAASDLGVNADLVLVAAHLRRNELDQALKAIADMEKKQPENPLAHHLRGAVLLGKQDIAGARRSFEQALLFNPAYYPSVASLANIDIVENKPEEARRRLEAVIAKDPKNSRAHLDLAEFHAKRGGKIEEVAALIAKSIAASPADPAPRLALVGLYLRAGQGSKALASAQEAQVALPENAEILDAVGRAQLAVNEFNQALITYEKLATRLPGSPQPHLRIAEIQVRAKNKEAARQSLRKALELKPDLLEAQRAEVLLDLDAGRVSEALAVARQVQKQRPKETIGYILEGDIHAHRKSWGEAVIAYRNGLKQRATPDLAVKLHSVMGARGSAGEADRFAETWLKDHAKDYQFRLYLAELAGARKDYATAAKHYRTLVDAQPENPVMLNNLAWVAAQNGDPKAIEYAEKAYRLAPEQPAFMDTLGVLLVEKGETTRGLELLQSAVKRAPRLSMIRFNYAKALIKAGNKSEAKKELEELNRLGEKFSGHAELVQLLKNL